MVHSGSSKAVHEALLPYLLETATLIEEDLGGGAQHRAQGPNPLCPL